MLGWAVPVALPALGSTLCGTFFLNCHSTREEPVLAKSVQRMCRFD
jgi:hypothetical protein